MKDKKGLFFVALATMILTAFVTSLILINTKGVDTNDNNPIVSAYPTDMTSISVSVTPTDTNIPLETTTPTITNTITPSPSTSDNTFIGVFEDPEMAVMDLPDGEYYSFASQIGNAQTLHYMLNKSNTTLSNSEIELLDIASTYPNFYYKITYTSITNLSGAAAGNRWAIIEGDIDVKIQGEYNGPDNPGGSSNYEFIIARGDGAHGGTYKLTILDSDAIHFPLIYDSNIGDKLYLSGDIDEGRGGAALGTAYIGFIPTEITK